MEQKLQWKWCSTNLDDFYLAWKDVGEFVRVHNPQRKSGPIERHSHPTRTQGPLDMGPRASWLAPHKLLQPPPLLLL